MPKLFYDGHMFELAPSSGDDDVASRMNDAIASGRALVGSSSIPAGITLGRVVLANGHELIFSVSGSLPIAIESDVVKESPPTSD